MAYTFEQLLAADPANPSNVATNAAITIFAPGDPTQTPLVITDPSGGPLSNPIMVNANGFGSAFMADIDRVAWAGGGFTAFLTSYEGMKQVAVAAQTAAETAGADAAAASAAATTAVADTVTALNTNYVRFRDTSGNPIEDSLVTIVVDTALNDISDITVEAN